MDLRKKKLMLAIKSLHINLKFLQILHAFSPSWRFPYVLRWEETTPNYKCPKGTVEKGLLTHI